MFRVLFSLKFMLLINIYNLMELLIVLFFVFGFWNGVMEVLLDFIKIVVFSRFMGFIVVLNCLDKGIFIL